MLVPYPTIWWRWCAHLVLAIGRPVAGVLLIVNPDNDVYGNAAAASLRPRFWYRQLEKPTASRPRRSRTRSSFRYIHLWRMEGNAAH